jgi:hypothetical protein
MDDRSGARGGEIGTGEGGVIVKRTETGRGFGDKREFAVVRKFKENDIAMIEYEFDAWEGPVEAGQKGQYHRCRARVPYSERMRDVSSSCSFYGKLKAA